MKNFAHLISDSKMDPSTQNVLSQLCKLYAVHGIVENMGEFMQV
jgi:acyl-CoA oxidase